MNTNSLNLVGYLTGTYFDGYPVFLSVQELHDYEIDVSKMQPVYVITTKEVKDGNN